jgi:hypothetical protein
MVFRCMFVALDPASASVCKLAISPLQAIVVPTVEDACKTISAVLPLVVFLSERAPETDIPELVELAAACGAELVTLAHPIDTSQLTATIRDALRKGEARRVVR